GLLNGWLDHPNDVRGYLVLQSKDAIGQLTIKRVGPKMIAGDGINELCCNTYPAARLADRAFEHITHAKLPPDLLNVDRTTLISEARCPGGHEQAGITAQRCNDVFGNAFSKVILVRIAAHIGEREHRDRWLVG